jgi:hypothetical protein
LCCGGAQDTEAYLSKGEPFLFEKLYGQRKKLTKISPQND